MVTVAAAAASVAAESAGDSSTAAVGLLFIRVLLLKSSLFFPFPDAASANDDGSANSCLIA